MDREEQPKNAHIFIASTILIICYKSWSILRNANLSAVLQTDNISGT